MKLGGDALQIVMEVVKMFEVGRLCVKIAGRDAGRKCVVVDVLKDGKVLIDGDVRRRACNPKHLHPLKDVISLKKGASREEVAKEFKKLGLAVWETKRKTPGEKPRKKQRQKKEQKKPAAKEEKKAAEKAGGAEKGSKVSGAGKKEKKPAKKEKSPTKAQESR